MIYLSKEQIILLHESLVAVFGGSCGVRDDLFKWVQSHKC